jgi:ribosomal RNA-processing protein 12
VVRGRNGKPIPGQAAGKKDRNAGAAYILNEGDQPMDLLSRSIAGGVSSELLQYGEESMN